MKKNIFLLSCMLVAVATSVYAQNKVVVIPLNTTSKVSVSYAERNSWISIPSTSTEILKLTDASAGGVLSVSSPVRIVLSGALTIGNQASNGDFSVIECQFQVSDNSGPFTNVGVAMSTESIGNSNHDQRADIPLSTVIDRPAGSYNVRIVCNDIFGSAGSSPVVRTAAFSAVTTPN